ncbi:MAG TPA: hypothetical protein VFL91_10775 [Thermomicrobiales bacterium]|nr:hypothetical protein [Thermomicrobiales bacterium]
MVEYERQDGRMRRLVAELREAPDLPGELPNDEAAIVREALAGGSVHVIAHDHGISEEAVWDIVGNAARLASGRAPRRRVETGGLGSDTDPGITGGYGETGFGGIETDDLTVTPGEPGAETTAELEEEGRGGRQRPDEPAGG